MMEFNKIFCDLHPNELISNYCAHGIPYFIQISVMLDSAPPASALTPRSIFRKEQHQITRTSELLTLKCRIISAVA